MGNSQEEIILLINATETAGTVFIFMFSPEKENFTELTTTCAMHGVKSIISVNANVGSAQCSLETFVFPSLIIQ